MKRFRQILISLAAIASAFAFGSAAVADTYPSRAIKVIVPYAPGGGADSFARLSAPELEKILGAQLIIENMAGANSAIGAQAMARAKPDGYTLLFTTDSTAVANPLLYKNLSYKAEDLVSVGTLNEVALGIVIADSLPIKTFKELVEYTKSYKGNLAYGSYGLGSQAHMMGEAYNKLTNSTLVHVPYKGAAPALIDLLGGHVPIGLTAPTTAIPHIKSGRLRALAVTSAQRSGALPEVPTVAESGAPGFDIVQWYAIWVAAKTPKDIVDKIYTDISAIIQSPDYKQRQIEAGTDVVGSTAEALSNRQKIDIEKYRKIAAAAGIKPE